MRRAILAFTALALTLAGLQGCIKAIDPLKHNCGASTAALDDCGYPSTTTTGWDATQSSSIPTQVPPASLTRVDPTTGPGIDWPEGVKYRDDFDFVQVECFTDNYGTWGAEPGSTIELTGYQFKVPVVVDNQDCIVNIHTNEFSAGGGGASRSLHFNDNDEGVSYVEWNTFKANDELVGDARWTAEAIVATGGEDCCGPVNPGVQRIRFNDISSATTGIHSVFGNIEHNYIHDLVVYREAGADDDHHVNGYARFGTQDTRRVTIFHNTIFARDRAQTDAVALFHDSPGEHNVVVDSNFLGGGTYTFYGSSSGGANCLDTSDIQVIKNRFWNDATYAPQNASVTGWCGSAPGARWEGNFYDRDGSPVNP